MIIFCAALIGAGLGFLWFNAYPAQVFMGDIGALSLGAALGVLAIVQVSLQVACLVHIVRRRDRPPGGRWLWAAVIVLGNLLGVIVYLAVGRRQRVSLDVPAPTGSDDQRVQRALEVLYDSEDSQ